MVEDRCPECGKSKINSLYCNYCGIFFNQSSTPSSSEERAGAPVKSRLAYDGVPESKSGGEGETPSSGATIQSSDTSTRKEK